MEKGVAEKLEATLQRALVDHDVKEYPDAGHAFMNKHDGLLFKVMRIALVKAIQNIFRMKAWDWFSILLPKQPLPLKIPNLTAILKRLILKRFPRWRSL